MTGDIEVILTDNKKEVKIFDNDPVTLYQLLYLPSGVHGGWATNAENIDPTSVISMDSEIVGDVEIGPGVIISSNSKILNDVKIEKSAKILGSTISGGTGGISIGEYAQISGSRLMGSGVVISGEEYKTIIKKSALTGDFLINPECNLNKIQVTGKFLMEDGIIYAGGVFIDGSEASNFIVPQGLAAGFYKVNELGNLIEVDDE